MRALRFVPVRCALADRHDPSGLDLARSIAAALRTVRTSGRPGAIRQTRSGSPPRISGPHPDDRDPAPLVSIVERLVAENGWSDDLAVRRVFARWPAIVGQEVAAHCTPESFRDDDKVVEVHTDSTAWATQLRLLAPTVVRRLNEELGHGTVSRIDVRGPQVPSWRRGRRSVRGRGPRDTYG